MTTRKRQTQAYYLSMETHPVAVVLAVASMCYTRSRLRPMQSVRFRNYLLSSARRTRHQWATALADFPPHIALHKRATEVPSILRCGPYGFAVQCLDMLTILRELEARIPHSDDAYDMGSDRSSPLHVLSPTELSDVPTDASFSVSVMRVGGRRESILAWNEEEDDFNVDKEDECVPRERWDEWLVLGSSWLYKQDLKIEQLGKQQDAVAQYLDTVDEVLFCRAKGSVRGGRLRRSAWRSWSRRREGRPASQASHFPRWIPSPPSRPRKLLAAATPPDGWHLRICWTPCGISLSRRSLRCFRRERKSPSFPVVIPRPH